jgi:hypothetical protein
MNTTTMNTNTETTEIKYHTPTGIYDIELVQFFEAIRDRILYKGTANYGLCAEIYGSSKVHRHRIFDAAAIMNSYMPHKDTGYFWWPCWNDPISEPCEIEQGFHDRVAFLNRIIEDLMCGV